MSARLFAAFGTILCLAWFPLLSQQAQAGTVALVQSDQSTPHREFADAFAQTLNRQQWAIVAPPGASSDARAEPDVYIAVGSEALSKLLRQGTRQPIMAVLLTRAVFERLQSEAGGSARLTAIYLDQPPARQLAFVRQITGNRERIGLITHRDQGSLTEHYRTLAKSTGQTLRLESTDSPAGLQGVLNTMLPQVDVLLTLPDNRLINRETVRPLLITALRYQKPVIAYSPALVSAGALAALYTTPQQIAEQAADILPGAQERLPAPQYPRLFTIAVNQSVADVFAIELRDESLIRRALGRIKDAP